MASFTRAHGLMLCREGALAKPAIATQEIQRLLAPSSIFSFYRAAERGFRTINSVFPGAKNGADGALFCERTFEASCIKQFRSLDDYLKKFIEKFLVIQQYTNAKVCAIMTLTLLVTGGSSGIGLNVALAALESGHAVIATARDPDKAKEAHPELERLGGRWLMLDVTQDDTEQIVKKVSDEYGIDVVINSAGYALLGAVEDVTPAEMRDQMNTNVFGALRVIKGILPIFRRRRAGTIVNVSSGAGLVGRPSRGAYAASKFALEGMSEALSAEVSTFNIRVLIVDLGAFSTNFTNTLNFPARPMTTDYMGTVTEETIEITKKMSTLKLGNARKAAERIVEAVTGTGMASSDQVKGCLRLILGSDCLKVAREKHRSFGENCDVMEDIAASTDPTT